MAIRGAEQAGTRPREAGFPDRHPHVTLFRLWRREMLPGLGRLACFRTVKESIASSSREIEQGGRGPRPSHRDWLAHRHLLTGSFKGPCFSRSPSHSCVM